MPTDSPLSWTAGEARAALAAAPVARLDALAPAGPILVVAPHPDDETLGCGGLIALACAAGRAVRVAVLTDGDASHPGSRLYPPARLGALRRGEARSALAILGAGEGEAAFFGAGDGALEEREDAADAWLAALPPARAVFAPWEADPHPDHQAAWRVARRHAGRLGAALFAYPVWGLTLADGAGAGARAEALRLDVGRVLELKRRAVAAHASQTTALIADDPAGFRLRAADLERHLQPTEPYLRFV